MDLILSVIFIAGRPGLIILAIAFGIGFIAFIWPKDSYNDEEIYVSTVQKESEELPVNNSSSRT